MHIDEQINLLLDMALDYDTPDSAQAHLLAAVESILAETEDDLSYVRSDDEAWRFYCTAYDGKSLGLAERREVMLPDALGHERDMGWSHELLRRLAKRERMQDDAMYAHCAGLMFPRPLSGA